MNRDYDDVNVPATVKVVLEREREAVERYKEGDYSGLQTLVQEIMEESDYRISANRAERYLYRVYGPIEDYYDPE